MDPLDHTWRPRVLAAPANGGANGSASYGAQGGAQGGAQDGADAQAASAPASPRPARPARRKRVSQARPGHAGNWRIRGTVLRQRLAAWFIHTRKDRLHMSLRELQSAAHADGVSLSVTSIQRIESLVDPQLANERSWIAFDYVLWLAAYSGQSLADVDRFITSGDWRYVGNLADAAMTEESQADRVRVNFLSLSPKRKQEVLDFITFARSLDEADQAAELGLRPRAERQTAQQPGQQPIAPTSDTDRDTALDPHTQGVLDDIARGEEVVREELRRHEEQAPGEAGEQPQSERPQPRQQRRRADQS